MTDESIAGEAGMTAAKTQLADYQPTKLVIPARMALERYQELLASLGSITKGHQWWVGDALVYGEKTYEENVFVQAAETLGLEPHTLVNWRWVADSVAPSRRREALTWSHHAEVARLEPKDQTAMLRQAIDRGWGIRQLREAVAIKHPRAGSSSSSESRELSDADEALINRRLEGLAVALENARDAGADWHEHLDLEDVQWLYRLATTLMRGGRP